MDEMIVCQNNDNQTAIDFCSSQLLELISSKLSTSNLFNILIKAIKINNINLC